MQTSSVDVFFVLLYLRGLYLDQSNPKLRREHKLYVFARTDLGLPRNCSYHGNFYIYGKNNCSLELCNVVTDITDYLICIC